MAPRQGPRWLVICVCWASLPLFAAGTVAAQAPPYTRAVPTIHRPVGSPDPAARVRRLGGVDAPALRLPAGAGGASADDYLYRRGADGAYVAITAPAYAVVNSTCPAHGAIDIRARMIDLAVAEWAWFGFPSLDVTARNETAVPRAGDLELVDAPLNIAIGQRAIRRAMRLGLMEDDAAVRPTIAGYWAATGSDAALRTQALVNFGDPLAGWSQPWSAAFVSWLACESGLSTQQFQRSGRHFDYVRAAVAARDGQNPEHAYVAYDLAEARPTHGDLICAARAGSDFSSLADIRSAGADESTALHCDLVVKTDASRGRLYAIGGNVTHAVTLSAISINAEGRPLADADVIGAARWFAVLKFRGVPNPAHDLDCTPTVLGLAEGYRNYADAVGASPAAPLTASTGPRQQGCAR